MKKIISIPEPGTPERAALEHAVVDSKHKSLKDYLDELVIKHAQKLIKK